MEIQVLIYCYIAVCVSVILFDIFCVFMFKHNEKRLNRQSKRMYVEIRKQLDNIELLKPVCRYHITYLSKRLKKVGMVMAFDRAMEEAYERDQKLAEEYIKEIHSVFIHIALVYLERDSVKAAYVAHIFTKYKIALNLPIEPIGDIMLEYLKSESIYCRQNALNAIISFGNEEKVLEAVRIIDSKNLYLHEKIYYNGLIEFTGDHKRLAKLLFSNFNNFGEKTQIVILNYIRFTSGDYHKEMFEILNNPSANRELHFVAIRYFGKNYYSPSLPLLIDFLKLAESDKWEYSAISALALSNYPCLETVNALKEAVSNSSWYVRFNASKSLRELGVDYIELIDVINGYDKYAREMILYRIESTKMNNENLVMN